MQAWSANGVRESPVTACVVLRIERTGLAAVSSWHLVQTRTASAAAAGASARSGAPGARQLAASASNAAARIRYESRIATSDRPRQSRRRMPSLLLRDEVGAAAVERERVLERNV